MKCCRNVYARFMCRFLDAGEDDVLRVDGGIDFSKSKDMEPLYAEYNVGHFERSFTLSGAIDKEKIGANLEDGVLTLTLPKARQAQPRKIAIG